MAAERTEAHSSEDQSDRDPSSCTVPIENLFTLPWALYLQPLPHKSFLVHAASSESSEDEYAQSKSSSNSSEGSNYHAGQRRLSPVETALPAHALRTISILLDNTRSLEAVPLWTKIFELLDKADDDPHFSNLRAFFDARFSKSGKRIVYPKQRSESHSKHSKKQQRTGSFQQSMGSPPRFADHSARRPSATSAIAPALLLRRRTGSRRQEDPEETSSLGEGSSNLGPRPSLSSRPRAPEIFVTSKDGEERRAIRFKVRLDFHSVGLAPPPPRPPNGRRPPQQQSSSLSSRLVGSPKSKSSDVFEMGRVTSNSSSDHSVSDGLSLHPVASPDSYRSRTFSDTSDGGPTSLSHQMEEMSSLKDSKRSNSKTIADPVTFNTSDFSTSPESLENRKTNAANASNRRPSMIQRLMDFKGLRSQRIRSRSQASSYSNSSVDQLPKEKGIEQPTFQKAGADNQPFSADVATARHPSQNVPKGRNDYDSTEEEALDIADDDISVTSSSAQANKWGRRTSSFGLLGYKPTSDLQPVQETAAMPPSNSESYHQSSIPEENTMTFPEDGSDFLSLLRRAANTSLALHRKVNSPLPSPARTPRGAANVGASTPSSIREQVAGVPDLDMEEQTNSLLAPFKAGGSNAWWLSGSADPLPISIACSMSQAFGWNGIMDLCYGANSQSEKAADFLPLGRAAEMDQQQKEERTKVQDWAQHVEGFGSTEEPFRTGPNDIRKGVDEKNGIQAQSHTTEEAEYAESDGLAPSESASAKGETDAEKSKAGITKIGRLFQRKVRRESRQSTSDSGGGQLFSSHLDANVQKDKDNRVHRTWQDWAELTKSISQWFQEYETCRVRAGLAGEIGQDVQNASDTNSTSLAYHPDSCFLSPGQYQSKASYSSTASYQVPYCVVKDALNRQHGFRRRDGIPEGLPLGPNGEEIGQYRWSRNRLSASHFATSSMLAASSLAHYMNQLATADWIYSSGWELDYLEMCVFKSPIVAQRFPPPGKSVVGSSQQFRPTDGADRTRAMPCPYPDVKGVWNSSSWLRWLEHLQSGKIVVPAISWQAWWTLIAILNGADGTDRALDVQLKAEEEPFSALNDLGAVYM